MRLLLRDTSTGRQLLQDEEVAFYLTQNSNNLYRAGADAARSLASREAKSKSVGDLSIAGLGDNWLLVAADLDRRADVSATPFAGGIAVSDKDSRAADVDRVQGAFTRSLHTDPDQSTRRST